MSARSETYALMAQLDRRGVSLTFAQAHTLRRAQMTLHRWAELECGDSNDWRSWSIERDETTGRPSMCIYPHDGKPSRYTIPDREAGALRRVATVCAAVGAFFFHQTDPRGCALYIASEPLTDTNYSGKGAPCVV